MSVTKIYNLPGGIKVTVFENVNGERGGKITSRLEQQKMKFSDVVESIVLAHACAGVDIDSVPYRKGLDTALNTIADRFF